MANWPLILVAIAGIVVAVRSLGALKDQVAVMDQSAKDAAKEMVLLNRAYLTVDTFMPNVPNTGQPSEIEIRFRIVNPSKAAARIEGIEYSIGSETSTQNFGTMLTPREALWVTIPPREVRDGEVLTIRGRITYRDIFGRERHRRFAQMCICSAQQSHCEVAEGIGLNDEEEWDKNE